VLLAIRRALLEHHVLVIKDQDLNEAQFKTFATAFGDIFQNPAEVPVLASAAQRNGVAPDVVPISNVDGYTGTGELAAHADHRWTPYPSAGSLLYALEVPSAGGETSFTNLNLAYDTLDPQLKGQIEELELITYNPFLRGPGDPRPRYREPGQALLSPVFPHPLVGTHPESGKKLLSLCAATEVEVVGLPHAAGATLVAQLREHLANPRFVYTHRWSVGDIVYWDNRAVLHARTAFDPGERRVLRRISLAGSRPF
jgi:taurine dioxygenase